MAGAKGKWREEPKNWNTAKSSIIKIVYQALIIDLIYQKKKEKRGGRRGERAKR